jgi:hypothetical protein
VTVVVVVGAVGVVDVFDVVDLDELPLHPVAMTVSITIPTNQRRPMSPPFL